MDVHLRKWNIKVFFGKSLIYIFHHIEINIPVVGTVHPYSGGDIHGTIAQLNKSEEGLGIFQDLVVGLDQGLQYTLCFGQVVALGDAEFKVYPSFVLCRVIDHRSC